MHKSGARRKAEDPRASFDRRVTAYATEHHATYLPSTRLRPNTQLRYCGDGNKKESLDQEMEQDYKRCFRLAIGESPDCHSVTGRDLRERLVGDPICNYPWQRSGNPSSFFLSSVSFFFFFSGFASTCQLAGLSDASTPRESATVLSLLTFLFWSFLQYPDLRHNTCSSWMRGEIPTQSSPGQTKT